MAKGTTLLDKNKNIVYPRTILEQVYNKAGTARLDVLLSTMRENLEGDIADTNVVVARLRADLDALLADSTLSGKVLDAIVEIKTLLDSNSSDVVAELVATMSALRDEAIRNVAQELTLSQKQQARQNIDAAGVSATYGDGLATLSYGGNAIFPETKGNQVKLSIGGNAEDAIKANGENIEKERVRAIAREDEIAETLVETKEKVDTFLADADTSEQAIDKLKELQEYIKNDETSASQMLGDIAQNKQDIADNATNIEKEATRAKQVEMYLESQKADKYGYYENLSVGVSDNLSGRGEATESEFAMRPSGGENKSIKDGTARINSIKGNSVVYNQLVKPHYIKATLSPQKNLNLNLIQFEYGHKYLFLKTQSFHRDVYFQSDGTIALCRLTGDVNSKIVETTSTKEITSPGFIYNSGNEDFEVDTYIKVVDLTKMFNGVNIPTTVEEFESLYGNMPDEYNEGTIIDNHTTAIKSVGVNAWDEEWKSGGFDDMGEFTSVVSIVSKNFNRIIPNTKYYMSYQGNSSSTGAYIQIGFWDKDYNFLSRSYVNNREFTTPDNACYFKISSNAGLTPPITTYKHDVCIHLVHTGYLNGKYFPYESQTRQLPTVEGGLKSTRYECDEIRYNKGKDKWEYVKRIGQVDLGTLDWELYNVERKVYVVVLKGELATKPVGDAICSNIYKYDDGSYANMADKSISLHPSMLNGNILLRNTDISSVSELKLSLQGVILNYELAEPVVTELDVDISPDYKVWDYGTEEAISKVLSTPVRINTNYGFNAVGQITDNTELIKELLARVAALEAQIAQANSVSVNVEPIVE